MAEKPKGEVMSEFDTNIIRAQLAVTWFATTLQVSRDLFGKSYLSLSVPERMAVDQMMLGFVSSNFQAITPEWLAAQQARPPMGFQAPTGPQATDQGAPQPPTR
jgi:hypothetical protein